MAYEGDAIGHVLMSLRLQRETVKAELDRIDRAIEALDAIKVAEPDGPVTHLIAPSFASLGERPSVRQLMQALLDEKNEDWSVGEIIDEYKARGTPIRVKNPANSVRAAINDALEAKRIERTAHGRYRSTLWRLGPAKGGMKLR